MIVLQILLLFSSFFLFLYTTTELSLNYQALQERSKAYLCHRKIVSSKKIYLHRIARMNQLILQAHALKNISALTPFLPFLKGMQIAKSSVRKTLQLAQDILLLRHQSFLLRLELQGCRGAKTYNHDLYRKKGLFFVRNKNHTVQQGEKTWTNMQKFNDTLLLITFTWRKKEMEIELQERATRGIPSQLFNSHHRSHGNFSHLLAGPKTL